MTIAVPGRIRSVFKERRNSIEYKNGDRESSETGSNTSRVESNGRSFWTNCAGIKIETLIEEEEERRSLGRRA